MNGSELVPWSTAVDEKRQGLNCLEAGGQPGRPGRRAFVCLELDASSRVFWTIWESLHGQDRS